MADAFHLKFLLATFAGWVNRHHAMVIDYLAEENRMESGSSSWQMRDAVGFSAHELLAQFCKGTSKRRVFAKSSRTSKAPA